MTSATATRNKAVYAARAAGKTLQAIADEHGLTRERVRQILLRKGATSETLARFPGAESLSPQARGLLIRLGYCSREQVVAALEKRVLRQGSTFGLGAGRFAEIVKWATFPDQ